MKSLPDNAFCNFTFEFLRTPEFNVSAVVKVYAVISTFCNMNGCCEVKNSFLQEELGIDKSTIARCLKSLEEKSFISIKYENNIRKIELPRFSTYQAVHDFVKVAQSVPGRDKSKDVEVPGVVELVDKINARQKEKYPGFKSTNFYNGQYSAQLRLVILTLAKAVFNSEFVGIKLAEQKVTERLLHDLVDIFDIGLCHKLVSYMADNFEKIEDLDRYILTGVINSHTNALKKLEQKREIEKREQEALERLSKLAKAGGAN